jgi:hypothetical protein
LLVYKISGQPQGLPLQIVRKNLFCIKFGTKSRKQNEFGTKSVGKMNLERKAGRKIVQNDAFFGNAPLENL